MNLQDIIDRSEFLANGMGTDSNVSSLIDSEVTAQALYPHAVRFAIKKLASMGGFEADVNQQNHILIGTGSGNLPSGVLREFLDQSFIDGVQFASYVKNYSDYTRYKFNTQMSYYTVLGSNILYSGGDGTINLYTPTIPDLPGDITQAVPLTARVVEEVITTIAAALRGELPLAQLMEA